MGNQLYCIQYYCNKDYALFLKIPNEVFMMIGMSGDASSLHNTVQYMNICTVKIEH